MSATSTIDFAPRFAEGDPMRVIGLARRYGAGSMARIPEQWQQLQERLGEVRGRTEEAQFGLFYRLGERPFAAEYVSGAMVGDDAPLPAGFVERRLPARRHAVFAHRGHLAGLRPLVDAIFREWLPRSGLAAGQSRLRRGVRRGLRSGRARGHDRGLGAPSRLRRGNAMSIRGSCRCGKIAYTADVEPTEAIECNCSICRRKGFVLAAIAPEAFHLETPRDDIAVYTFNRHVIRHQFCKACGCAPFAEGTGPDGRPMVALNLRCAEVDLSTVTITPFDGASL